MFSFSFNGVNCSTYGLTVVSRDINIKQAADSYQLPSKSYADDSKISPKTITLDVAITGATASILKNNIDNIKQMLNLQIDGKLSLDSLSDRYWNARFQSLSGSMKGQLFSGQIIFICYDPNAYSVIVTSNEYDIDEDPKSIMEEVTGMAPAEPVYSLTAGEDLPNAEIHLKNTGTSQELIWEGNLEEDGVLAIDIEHWLVTKNDEASMPGVSGQFPFLAPGYNVIEVSGFGDKGTLTITYRNRYW